MTELKELASVVDIAVGITILLGTGAAVTWWITRRIEDRIESEVNHMDRLQSIEKNVADMGMKMATKEDMAEMTAQTKEDMAEMTAQTKMDMAELASRMATKEDMAEMATQTKIDMAEMATKMATQAKEDVAGMASRMATKEDMASMATGMDALKTELLEAIKNANGNAHR